MISDKRMGDRGKIGSKKMMQSSDSRVEIAKRAVSLVQGKREGKRERAREKNMRKKKRRREKGAVPREHGKFEMEERK